MAIIKSASESSKKKKTPWLTRPSYRRFTSLQDTPNTTTINALELLAAIAISIDMGCFENINGNIPIKHESKDSAAGDISSSYTDKGSAATIATGDTSVATPSAAQVATTAASVATISPPAAIVSTTGTVALVHATTASVAAIAAATDTGSPPASIATAPVSTMPTPAVVAAPIGAATSASSAAATMYVAAPAATPATAPSTVADAGFKSWIPNISTQEDIDDELCLPLSYQFMFDKRTSPWEMQDWDQDKLNAFVIQAEKIDRLYHMVANDEDPNFRCWEICCRMDYEGEKYFVEMYANCDYTGFDCQGGGHICITKLPDFFLSNMLTVDQNPDQIYKALLEDGYNVQEPDPLHKIHPKFWNNAPMLKYLCHNAIYKNKDVLPHFKEQLPQILANSVADFIKVKEWENE